MKKIISITIFGGLTVAAASACNWQFSRYHECVRKWDRVHSQFSSKHIPQQYDIQSVLGFNVPDWEYMVIEVQGTLKAPVQLVHRYREGRDGYMVLSAITSNNQGLIVNLGWLPEESAQEILSDNKFSNQLSQMKSIRCMIRKPEVKDFLTEKKGPEMRIATYINLEEVSSFYGIPESTLYLERVGKEDESGGIGDDLYPTPVFGSSLEKPYLTPDKHQGYYLFWGSCTCLGILTILRIIKM